MKKLLPYIALVLALAEGILMLLSWLLSAALPASGVRSMLSSEGIRWLMGHFSKILSTPLLSCLLLAAIAVGCLLRSGITRCLRCHVSHIAPKGRYGWEWQYCWHVLS